MNQPPKFSLAPVKWLVSLGAVAAAIAHMIEPRFIPDAISLGLLALALVPWIYPLIKTVELAGFGKLELRVDDIREKQNALKTEVDALRFLLLGFVTDWEFQHLAKLDSTPPFQYQWSMSPDDRFLKELVRLRDFGMIAKRQDFPMRTLPQSGDLKDYFELTDRGKAYLALRQSKE